MAAHLLYVCNARALQRERVFRDRLNPLDSYSDTRMHKYYRFTRRGIMRVIDLLEPHLQNETRRSHAIDPRVQIFVALRYYATGDFYSSTGVHHGISDSSVCRIVHRVTNTIAGLKDEYVKWPTSRQEVNTAQLGFYNLSNFPGAVGAIDCTHIRLDCAPLGDQEYAYVNRKGVHSLNVQLVCDSRYHITNVVARWPGSCHDSRILQNSPVWELFQQGHLTGMLLGDSGYPQTPWLMTPYRNVDTPAQRRYNEAHRHGRVVIEQTNGQLKMKFPCLRKGLRTAPDRACKVVVACVVLFNIAKHIQDPYLGRQHDLEDDIAPDYNGPANIPGNIARNQLVENCF